METRLSPSMQDLRILAHTRGLKYYQHLSKPELFSLLQRNESGGSTVRLVATATNDPVPTAQTSQTRRITTCCLRKRKARENDSMEDSRSRKKAKIVANTLDPILLTELGPYTFELTRTNGVVIVYNVESLVQYILATGDFSEPETRIPFSDQELLQMDREASKAGMKYTSVLNAKKNTQKYETLRLQHDQLLGLERCASEYVHQMLEIIESDDSEDGEILLVLTVFPSFSDIFEQIRKNNLEHANHCMGHFIQYLKGPTNRPTVDTSGLLPVILSFLDDVSTGKQDAKTFGF
ncbi:hypothetical protein CCR75_004400 [Bremia lactucae]|uniref:Uncharacterized protein n=1 Tax=Bremia lactucae TaxID=4779 RepID=A0A976FM37_BRELC|nr:hypothetical protein CCR75_004400 [Bremia lactucae]